MVQQGTQSCAIDIKEKQTTGEETYQTMAAFIFVSFFHLFFCFPFVVHGGIRGRGPGRG